MFRLFDDLLCHVAFFYLYQVLAFVHIEVFHLCNKFLKAMWVPTMIVTFRYVPVKFQVLVVNVVGVVWQTFLAYAAMNAHSSSSETEDDEEKNKDTSEQIGKSGDSHKKS